MCQSSAMLWSDRPPLDRQCLGHTLYQDYVHPNSFTKTALCRLLTACYKLLAAAEAAGHNWWQPVVHFLHQCWHQSQGVVKQQEPLGVRGKVQPGYAELSCGRCCPGGKGSSQGDGHGHR